VTSEKEKPTQKEDATFSVLTQSKEEQKNDNETSNPEKQKSGNSISTPITSTPPPLPTTTTDIQMPDVIENQNDQTTNTHDFASVLNNNNKNYTTVTTVENKLHNQK
jgi:hypothetical protein